MSDADGQESLGVAWLFCPADRPERFAKAAATADVVILDLEDGVAAGDRPAARQALVSTPLDPTRTVVRVNGVGTPDHAGDLEALGRTSYRKVMLAKTESGEHADALAPLEVYAVCETPRGVLHASAIAESSAVAGLIWGAEDLMAGLGGRSSRHPDGRYRDVVRHARSSVLLAAASAGKLAIDSVYLDIPDVAGLAAEAAEAVQSGFGAKALIHPSHVPVVRAAFQPSPEEAAWAARVLDAAQRERGVFAFEGKMVDEPLLRQARVTLARSAIQDRPRAEE